MRAWLGEWGALVGDYSHQCRNRQEAFVTVKGISIDVCIPDEKSRNRALEGDLVALRRWIQANGESDRRWRRHAKARLHRRGQLLTWRKLTRYGSRFCHSTAVRRSRSRSRSRSRGSRSRIFETTVAGTVNALAKKEHLQPSAKVVAVLERPHRAQQVGVLESEGAPKGFVRFRLWIRASFHDGLAGARRRISSASSLLPKWSQRVGRRRTVPTLRFEAQA